MRKQALKMDPLESLWALFLINNWCQRAKPTVRSAASGELVLGCIKSKLNELWEQTVHSFPPGPLLQFHPLGSHHSFHSDGLWCETIDTVNLFLCKLLWVMAFITAPGNKLCRAWGEAQPGSGIQYYNTPFKLMNWKPRRLILNNTVTQLPKNDRYS